jgi:hypothetical protein
LVDATPAAEAAEPPTFSRKEQDVRVATLPSSSVRAPPAARRAVFWENVTEVRVKSAAWVRSTPCRVAKLEKVRPESVREGWAGEEDTDMRESPHCPGVASATAAVHVYGSNWEAASGERTAKEEEEEAESTMTSVVFRDSQFHSWDIENDEDMEKAD